MNILSIPTEWLPQYTYKDYEMWEGDWELIFGLPYAMSPSPNRKHQFIEQRFIRQIGEALENKNNFCNCNVYHQLVWIVDENTVLRPDVMVVCGKFEEDFLRFPPTLVIEIASKNTRLKDRNIKFRIYESNGVKYYIIADPDKNNVEVFMLKDNRYQEVNAGIFYLTQSCIIELDFETIWQ